MLGADQPLARIGEELPGIAGILPSQRMPVLDSPGNALRAATVLLVDPDRTTRDPLRSGLVDIGVGTVLEASEIGRAHV